MGLHRVGHDWRDLAAVAVAVNNLLWIKSDFQSLKNFNYHSVTDKESQDTKGSELLKVTSCIVTKSKLYYLTPKIFLFLLHQAEEWQYPVVLN